VTASFFSTCRIPQFWLIAQAKSKIKWGKTAETKKTSREKMVFSRNQHRRLQAFQYGLTSIHVLLLYAHDDWWVHKTSGITFEVT
jgi:hypothetical protein